MPQLLIVTLYEDVEIFRIVAIAIAYLCKTGRDGRLPAAWWSTGTVASF